jgi:hypothetical protein
MGEASCRYATQPSKLGWATRVSVMYSFPNYIPLPVTSVNHILYPYERIYGAFWEMVIAQDGKIVVARSAERYLRAIS